MQLTINDATHEIPAEWQDASLLTVLRDHLGLTGTKFGCGRGICGACTVHMNGEAVRACVMPARAAGQTRVTTIEGLAEAESLHLVQQAWIDESVPQCGYCQPGQMMTAAAFIARNPTPSPAEVVDAMNGNLCRCGTYTRIRKGVLRAAELAREVALEVR
ncbi:MAG: (2Fe-2S)-binding protein [Pseudomonadota bacterium]